MLLCHSRSPVLLLAFTFSPALGSHLATPLAGFQYRNKPGHPVQHGLLLLVRGDPTTVATSDPIDFSGLGLNLRWRCSTRWLNTSTTSYNAALTFCPHHSMGLVISFEQHSDQLPA